MYLIASAEGGRVFPSAEVFPPAEGGRVFPSAEVFPSTEGGCVFPPAEGGRVFPSAEVGRVFPSAEVGRVFPSAEEGRVFPSAEGGRVFPSAEGGRVFPSAEGGRMYPSVEGGRVFWLSSRPAALDVLSNGRSLLNHVLLRLAVLVPNTSSGMSTSSTLEPAVCMMLCSWIPCAADVLCRLQMKFKKENRPYLQMGDNLSRLLSNYLFTSMGGGGGGGVT